MEEVTVFQDMNHHEMPVMSEPGKHLTFFLADEVFGLEILKVQEIIGIIDIVSVPKAPGYVRGVINLRGKVIPVFDLRLKFGMEILEESSRSSIIIVQVPGQDRIITIGVIVDEVSEVQDIELSQIEPSPYLGDYSGQYFIKGMAKIDQKIVILLDIEKVFSSEELRTINGLKK